MFESSEGRFSARCGTADFLRILLMDYPFGVFSVKQSSGHDCRC